MISKLSQFMLWLAIWLALSWPPTPRNLITGALVSIFVSVMTIDIFSGLYGQPAAAARIGPLGLCRRFLWFLCYIAVFVWECFKANFDVAYRVLSPAIPIRPGTIRVKIELKTDIAITFLANSLTLTPGNTTIDIDKEKGYIYVHRLYLPEGPVASSPGLAVADRFGKILKRIFE